MHRLRSLSHLAAALAVIVVAAACGGTSGGPGGPGGPGTGITGVTITPSTGTVPVGDTLPLDATVQPSGANQAVTWSTSSSAVATVGTNGVVTGVGPAQVTITATSQADPSRSASVTLDVICTTYTPLQFPTFVSSDTTVPPGCHALDAIKRVTDGATLTFEGPAVVRATGNAAGIRVEDGSLRSLGSAATPILFTSQAATPGSWHGFRIVSGTSGNELRHTTIEYAGQPGATAFHLRGGGDLFTGVRVEQNASVTLDSVTIRRTGAGTGSGTEYGAGLFLERAAAVTMQGTNRFVENVGPGVHVTAPQIAMLSSSADYGSAGNVNGVNAILVNDDSTSAPPAVTSSATWSDLGVPYRLARTVTIQGSGTLIDVGPAARFEAEPGAAISVQDGAGFRADGGSTPADRVVFTGTTDTAGAWIGLHINTDNVANELRNTRIAYAGQGTLGFQNLGLEAAVRVGDGVSAGIGGGQQARLVFVDNEVHASAADGLRLENAGTVIDPVAAQLESQNTFTQIAGQNVNDQR